MNRLRMDYGAFHYLELALQLRGKTDLAQLIRANLTVENAMEVYVDIDVSTAKLIYDIMKDILEMSMIDTSLVDAVRALKHFAYPESMKYGEPLTWDEIADLYDKAHPGARRAGCLPNEPMEKISSWLKTAPGFYIDPETDYIHYVAGNLQDGEEKESKC